MNVKSTKKYDQKIFEWILKVKSKASELSKSSQLEKRDCPNCGSGECSFFENNDSLDYVRCLDCQLVYMNPCPRAAEVNNGFQGQDDLLNEYFDIIIDNYIESSSLQVDPTTDFQLKDIFRIKNTGKLLDVGCSVGKFLSKAAYFYDVEGVEINPKTAKIAQKKFTVHTDFLANLDLEPTYDVVTLNQILYGVFDPVQLLKEIHKLLKDDGILYINTPNVDSDAVKLFGGKANHFYGYTSLNVYNIQALNVLAHKSGFVMETVRTEWFDIYAPDVTEFLNNRTSFIHKKNIHIPNYQEMIEEEDRKVFPCLGELDTRGNYIVAVLVKKT